MIALALLLSAQVATSTVPPPVFLGAELAHQIKVQMDEDFLRKEDVIDRFLKLSREQRSKFLSEWAATTRPEGRALQVYKWTRDVAEHGLPQRAESAVHERIRESALTAPTNLTLSREQLTLLIRGSRRHGYGGALIVSGVMDLVAAGILGLYAATNEYSMLPAGLGGALGAIILIIGVTVNSSGDDALSGL